MAAQGWDLEPIDRARFAEAAGGIAYWQSDEVAATRWYQEALDIWRELGDKGEVANALYNRSYADAIEIMRGGPATPKVGEGRARLEEARELYREIGDTHGEASVVWGLGSFYYFGADAPQAEDWYRKALEMHRMAGDRTMEAWSLHMLGLSVTGQRRWKEATDLARQALQHFYEAGDVSGVILVLDDLAIIATGLEDFERAGRLWGAARNFQRRTGTELAGYVEQTQMLFGVSTPPQVLSAEELGVLAAEGAAMSLDEVVAYALGTAGGVPPTAHAEVGS